MARVDRFFQRFRSAFPLFPAERRRDQLPSPVIGPIRIVRISVEQRTGREHEGFGPDSQRDALRNASVILNRIGRGRRQIGCGLLKQVHDVINTFVHGFPVYHRLFGRGRNIQISVNDGDRAVQRHQPIMVVSLQEFHFGNPSFPFIFRNIPGRADSFQKDVAVTDRPIHCRPIVLFGTVGILLPVRYGIRRSSDNPVHAADLELVVAGK